MATITPSIVVENTPVNRALESSEVYKPVVVTVALQYIFVVGFRSANRLFSVDHSADAKT